MTPNREFFQWIYDRLVNVHHENPDVDYMSSFKERIDDLFGDGNAVVDKPWRPSDDLMELLWWHAMGLICEGDPVGAHLYKLYCEIDAHYIERRKAQIKNETN